MHFAIFVHVFFSHMIFCFFIQVLYNSGTIVKRIKDYLRQNIWNPVMLVSILLLCIPGIVISNIGTICITVFCFTFRNDTLTMRKCCFRFSLSECSFAIHWGPRIEQLYTTDDSCRHISRDLCTGLADGDGQRAKGGGTTASECWEERGRDSGKCGYVGAGRGGAHADGPLALPVLHASVPLLRHVEASRAKSLDGRTHGTNFRPIPPVFLI